MGAELGYINFGSIKFSEGVGSDSASVKLKVQTVYAAVVGTLPFTPSLSGQAKVGLAIHQIRGKSSGTITDGGGLLGDGAELDADLSGSFTGSPSALLGLGLDYQFTPKLSAVIDYTYAGKVTIIGPTVSMLSLGLRFHF